MQRLLLFLVTVPFLTLGCRPAAPPVAVSDQRVTNGRQSGKPLSAMSWTDSEQRVQKLSDLNGKAVILDFWATYCPPCREEIPHLNSLLAKYGSDNLQIVGLNVGGEDDLPEIPKFIKTTKLDYPIAFPEDDLTRVIFAERDDIPQTAVFDRKGEMVRKLVGFGPGIQKDLDDAVAIAVATD
jgi:thiol-disulfide isomerase/thioredoxin